MTGMDRAWDPLGRCGRRFPLVARPRPVCAPLHQRVAQLSERARAADATSDASEASAVFNLAALLASDLGLPDLARHWCHRHAHAYLRDHPPLSAQAARRALEPVVNLARLHIRGGDGERAFTLIDTLFTAVNNRTDTTIDGIHIPAATLTTRDAHPELRRWLWATLLATGARALARAGWWSEADAQLRRYNGIGRRIFDGRQIAVLAHISTGDLDGALALLDDTTPGQPWENTVTTCLTALCRRHADQPADHALTTLLDHYRQLDTSPGLAVFHTRLGLAAIDATDGIDHPTARHLAADLIHRATTAPNGYTARDVLTHDGCAHLLTDQQVHDLSQLVSACALGRGNIPAPLQADLSTALDTSEAVLARTPPSHAGLRGAVR